jgi:hypothetical protein
MKELIEQHQSAYYRSGGDRSGGDRPVADRRSEA